MRPGVAIVLATGAAVAALSPTLGVQNVDFEKAYYPAARSVLASGTFEYTYEGLKNLPIVAALLTPFALAGPELGGRLFLAFGLASYAAAFWLLGSLTCRSRGEWGLLLLLFASNRHVYTCLQLGQLTPFCLLLLVAVAMARERRRLWMAGALLALAFLVKIPAGVVLVLFVYRRELPAVAGATTAYLGILGLSLLVFGLPLHGDYLEFAVLKNSGATLSAYNNASLAAAIERSLHPGGLFDWRMVEMPGWLEALSLGSTGLFFLGAWRTTTPRLASDPLEARLEMSMVLCLSLLTFPLTWDHYHVLLIPAFLFSLRAIEGPLRRPQLAAWTLAFILSNLPVLWIIGRPGDALPHVGLRNALPAAPLLGCLVLLLLLMWQYRAARLERT